MTKELETVRERRQAHIIGILKAIIGLLATLLFIFVFWVNTNFQRAPVPAYRADWEMWLFWVVVAACVFNAVMIVWRTAKFLYALWRGRKAATSM